LENVAPLSYSGWRLKAFEAIEVRAEANARDQIPNVISISSYVDQSLRANPSRRLWRIPNPVAVDIPPELTPPERVVYSYSGFIGRRKGLLRIIEAFARVRDEIPTALLRVFGPVQESDYFEACTNLVRQRDLTKSIRWEGPCPHNILWPELRKSVALVLASEEETAPMAISEALSLGVPVVSTEAGGIPDMFPNGEAGFVVPRGDTVELARAMARAAKGDEQVRLRRGALEASAPYQSAAVAADTISTYREILGCL
jgi:glycosyltransferase involved in cell wall biosynthesis